MEKSRTSLVVVGFALAGAALLHWNNQRKEANDEKKRAEDFEIAEKEYVESMRQLKLKLDEADKARWALRLHEISIEEDRPLNPDNETVNILWDLYGEFRDIQMENDPVSASMYGDHRYGHLLADLSYEGFNKQINDIKSFQNKLLKLIPSITYLPKNEYANYSFLIEMVELQLKKLSSWSLYEIPTNQLFGPHLDFIPSILQFNPRDTLEDRRDILSRLSAFDHQVNQMIGGFKHGIKKGITLPLSSIGAMIGQCEAQLVPKFELSPLSALIKPPPSSKEEDDDEIIYEINYIQSVEDIVMNSIIPAYYKLSDFLSNEYSHYARSSAGIYCWENSNSIYQSSLLYFTSLSNITSDEIHETGLKEVKRIKEEMVILIKKHGLSILSNDELRIQAGLLKSDENEKNEEIDLSKFMLALKSDPKQQPKSGEEILTKYQEILTISEKISREGLNNEKPIFNLLPKANYEIKAVESFREQHAPPAFYYPPSADGKRGGIFYANTYKPEGRGLFTMESIALHEAIPGHHFQIALAQELGGSPWLRKQAQDFCTAYIEGWGLYTEKLGLEMGFYTDPAQDFGRLTTEMMRAVRLVIDSGLHAKNWTRQQSIEYFKAHSAMGDQDINSEVDRYMVFPGQAVSYKMGELNILELRKYAENTLKEKFILSEFHDIILGSGALPLASLDETVKTWVESKK